MENILKKDLKTEIKYLCELYHIEWDNAVKNKFSFAIILSLKSKYFAYKQLLDGINNNHYE
jgi:hypothetical protein